MKRGILILSFVAIIAIVGLAMISAGYTANVARWQERYYNKVECPSQCWDDDLKHICKIQKGTHSVGGYCYGKPQQGLLPYCSCPVYEDLWYWT